MTRKRILLSPPHMSGLEQEYVAEAFRSNWIAPLGPQVDAFEREFCELIGCDNALALCSGTAAIHLALVALGVGPGDEVLVSSFTFSASVNPVRYVGATPVFIDSEERSWNLDPSLLADVLARRAKEGRVPKALILVDLYGQTADMDSIVELCERYGVNLIEDAAEALGATHGGRSAGTFGRIGVFSFNGNKIITTSGGGMLVSAEQGLTEHARKLSTQARDKAPYYQHTEIGFNYRLSNILAAIGRGQLKVLDSRVRARRQNFEAYRKALDDIDGLTFMPEADWGRSNRWLTCLTLDSELPTNVSSVIEALAQEGIEARRLWKPMHLQPIFSSAERFGGSVSERLFSSGLCLPSGSSLSKEDLDRVAGIIRREVGAKVAA
jgi:dTDP-4-amino-4,6-dideoxygalactose transaminase